MTPLLSIHNLTLKIEQHTILNNISFELGYGDYCCILGPNGAGKSSLLKILMGIMPATRGKISYQNQSLSVLSQKQRARLISYVPQSHSGFLHFTVEEFIRMSRYAHHTTFSQWMPDDSLAVDYAIAITHIEPFVHRQISTLSGGETQRVMIAGAVCQQSPVILLDEPGSFLDPHHQVEIHHLIQELNQQHNISIIEVSHDINHAVHHSQHIAAMKQGEIIWFGAADTFLEPQRLHQLYDQYFVFTSHPQTGKTIALNSEKI